MEFIGIIADKDDFLAHHGTKGMKWGVWNAETAAKYAGAGKTGNAAGGGGGIALEDENDDSDDTRPEALLEKGAIDEKTAKAMRASLDRLIERMENGQISEEEYVNAVNGIYERNKLKAPYDETEIKRAAARDYLPQSGVNPYDGEAKAKEQLSQYYNDIKPDELLAIKRRQQMAESGEGTPNSTLEFAQNKIKGYLYDAKAMRDAFAPKTGGYKSGGATWSPKNIRSQSKLSTSERVSNAREMAREWSPDGFQGAVTTIGKTAAVERQAAKNKTTSGKTSTMQQAGTAKDYKTYHTKDGKTLRVPIWRA